MRQDLKTANSVAIILIILFSAVNVAYAVSPNVSALSAPTVTVSQNIIDQGQIAILNSSAVTTGTPPYSYQWLEQTPNSTVFVSINGATSGSYRFDSTGAALGNWSFMLQTTDSTSTTVDSNVVSITVDLPMTAPVIQVTSNSNYTQTQTWFTQINQGDWVKMSLNPYNGGGEPPFTYLWLSQPPGDTTFSALYGAKSDSYSFQTTAYIPLGNYSFELEIADNAGSVALSNVVTVTVNRDPSDWPRLVCNITVVNLPNEVAYDSGTGEIFVSGDDAVSVISDANNTVVATITLPFLPGVMCYDPSKEEIFVANPNGNTVSVISDKTNSIVANISVGTSPNAITYDSGRNEVFVTNANNTVLAISDSTNTVVATINVGAAPSGVAYDPNNGEIYVANYNDSTISIVSDTTNTVIATIPVEYCPGALTCDYGKGEVFVNYPANNSVSVISDKTNLVISTVSVGVTPYGIAYDFGKGEIYVTNMGSDTMSVISDSNNSVIANVPAYVKPAGLCYDFGRREIFVTNFASGATPVEYWISNTVLVFSDSPLLASPLVSLSSTAVDQGQTAVLTSQLTTGISPYKYQWYSEPPGSLAYVKIDNATAFSYSFVTSNSTAIGNWNFMLQVTDATGASVNSTASTVTVTIIPHTAIIVNSPSASNVPLSIFGLTLVILVIVVAVVIVAAFVRLRLQAKNNENNH